ncbi:MAG: hypothetical protein FWB78_11705, partial [Treponema sp.]|nr:hypothetical protein [Treponema sp.]
LPNNPAKPRGGTDAFRSSSSAGSTPLAEDMRRVTAQVLEEKTDKVLQHLETVLVAASGGERSLGRMAKRDLREKLYEYIERNYNELLNRLSHGGAGGFRRTHKEVGNLLGSMDGVDRFNTGEIEKFAPAESWDHLEAHANGILMAKSDAAAFVPVENTCNVLSCVFKDNACKPKTVTDVKLSLNIPEYDLIPPSVRHKATALYLIGKIICGHLSKGIDREAHAVIGKAASDSSSPSEEAKPSQGELAGRILERSMEKAVPSPDPQDMARNIAAKAMLESTRRHGFDGAFALFVSVLADCGLDYQVVEKLASAEGGYDVAIREYEDTDIAALPDECFALRLRYFDQIRLDRERRAYDTAVGNFDAALGHFRDLLEVIYQDSKSIFKVNDFDDLAKKNRNRTKAKVESGVEKDGVLLGRNGLAQVRDRMRTVCEYLNPAERRISEERLAFLEKEYARFECMINPYRIQPGILLDVDVSSIKRKKTTLNSMSKALNEFLKGLSNVFRQD